MLDKLSSHPAFPKILIFLIPFLLYTNTFRNDYALDDSIVITQNEYVQQGFQGLKEIFTSDAFTGFFKEKKELVAGGRYRPLSIASFAIEEGLGIGTAGFRHFINAVLYGLVCLSLFSFITKLLIYFEKNALAVPAAFISSMIFAFHPLHTEVVANIKGRDELFTVLFAFISLGFILNYLKTGVVRELLFASLIFFMALLSKENALAILPLVVIMILAKPGAKAMKLLQPLGSLIIVALIYLIIRNKYTGGFEFGSSNELMNNPFLEAGNKRFPTIFYTLFIYLKLLVFPAKLTFDYYPYHIELQNWANPLVIFSVLFHSFLLVFALINLRRRQVISFAILFYLICLFPTSNLVVNVGSFMNERFLFFPSAGFALGAGYGLKLAFDSKKNTVRFPSFQFLFLIVMLLFALKTLDRNKTWANNETLFLTDVKTSAGSAKGNCMAGGVLYESAILMDHTETKNNTLDQSIRYLERALEIYPNYVDALLLIGNAVHVRDGDCKKALEYYTKIFELSPNYGTAFSNLISILKNCQETKIQIRGFQTILNYQSHNFNANYQLGLIYGKALGELDTAEIYLENAVKIRPDNKTVNRDLGVVYAMQHEYEKSIFYFEKVLKLDPDDADNYINLGVSFQNTGRMEDAVKMFAMADSLKAK